MKLNFSYSKLGILMLFFVGLETGKASWTLEIMPCYWG